MTTQFVSKSYFEAFEIGLECSQYVSFDNSKHKYYLFLFVCFNRHFPNFLHCPRNNGSKSRLAMRSQCIYFYLSYPASISSRCSCLLMQLRKVSIQSCRQLNFNLYYLFINCYIMNDFSPRINFNLLINNLPNQGYLETS